MCYYNNKPVLNFFSDKFSLARNYPILPSASEIEDEDVAMERSKVLGGHCNNAVLRMESLTKVGLPVSERPIL